MTYAQAQEINSKSALPFFIRKSQGKFQPLQDIEYDGFWSRLPPTFDTLDAARQYIAERIETAQRISREMQIRFDTDCCGMMANYAD